MWSNKYKRDNDKSYYWLPAVKEEITKIKEREVTGSGQMTGGQRERPSMVCVVSLCRQLVTPILGMIAQSYLVGCFVVKMNTSPSRQKKRDQVNSRVKCETIDTRCGEKTVLPPSPS